MTAISACGREPQLPVGGAVDRGESFRRPGYRMA
jgi:hypothetical protein